MRSTITATTLALAFVTVTALPAKSQTEDIYVSANGSGTGKSTIDPNTRMTGANPKPLNLDDRMGVVLPSTPQAATGTVKWVNPVKGFGFIEPEDGSQDTGPQGGADAAFPSRNRLAPRAAIPSVGTGVGRTVAPNITGAAAVSKPAARKGINPFIGESINIKAKRVVK